MLFFSFSITLKMVRDNILKLYRQDPRLVTRENIGVMLGQMREDQPQMRAAFLRYQQEKLGYGDFFAELSL